MDSMEVWMLLGGIRFVLVELQSSAAIAVALLDGQWFQFLYIFVKLSNVDCQEMSGIGKGFSSPILQNKQLNYSTFLNYLEVDLGHVIQSFLPSLIAWIWACYPTVIIHCQLGNRSAINASQRRSMANRSGIAETAENELGAFGVSSMLPRRLFISLLSLWHLNFCKIIVPFGLEDHTHRCNMVQQSQLQLTHSEVPGHCFNFLNFLGSGAWTRTPPVQPAPPQV